MKGKELRLEIAQFKLGPCYCFLSVLLAACPLLLIRLQRRHQLWHNTQRLILSRTGPPQPKLLAGSQPSPEGKATLHVLSSIQSRLKLGARGIANDVVHNVSRCVLHAAVGDTESHSGKTAVS